MALLPPILLPVLASAQLASHSYDILRYEIEIRPDLSSGRLQIETDVHISNPQGESAFRFGLSAQYDSVTVTVEGRPVAARRSGAVVEVSAPAEGTAARLHFTMCGNALRSEDEDRPAIDRDSLFLLWSDRFYPIDFADWAVVRTSVLLPAGMHALAPGTLRSTRATAEGVWHTFESATPAIDFSVFADRRWILTERAVGSIRMITLLHPESQRFADALFETSGDVLAYYTWLHGFYPADQFAFVTLTGMYARRAFPGFVGYEPGYLEKTMLRDGYDGHETALMWWGYAAHGEGAGAFQWTEGFGDYVEMLYAQARQKPVPFSLQRAREAYLAMPPGPDPPLTDLGGNTPQPLIHGRLPWRMDAVRRGIGDEAFCGGIRTLFDRYRYRTFTLEQFVAVFEEAASPDVRPSVRGVLLGEEW